MPVASTSRNMSPTDIICVCGPSGVGKTTLIERLIKENNQDFELSISCTTRNPRGDEKHGVEYYFVTDEEFDAINFYETVFYRGTAKKYGTTKNEIKRISNAKKIPILDVHIDAIEQLRKHNELNAVTIFVKPPSLEELRKRLLERSKVTKESEAAIEKRLSVAPTELEQFGKIKFDHCIVNDDLDNAFKSLCEIVKGVKTEKIKKNVDNSNKNGNLNLTVHDQRLSEVNDNYVKDYSVGSAKEENAEVEKDKSVDNVRTTKENAEVEKDKSVAEVEKDKSVDNVRTTKENAEVEKDKSLNNVGTADSNELCSKILALKVK